MKISRKKGILAIIVIVVIVLLMVILHYGFNYKQYIKYCEGLCDSKIVSNQLLEEVIEARTEKEISQIEQNSQAINRDVIKLNNAELNEDEKDEYSSNSLKQVYDTATEYDIDQLISLGNEYEQTLNVFDQLIVDNQNRILKDKIEQTDEHIAKLRNVIKEHDLNDEEKADYENSLDYYNQIDYDSSKEYSVSELNVFLSEYGLSEINFENDLDSVKSM